MADTRIDNYNGTSDKEVRLPGAAAIAINKFLATEYNNINDFLLALKELRGSFEMNQDLNITSPVKFLDITLSNFTNANQVAISDVTGKLIPITIAALKVLLSIPEDRTVKQTIVTGINVITFATPFTSTSWAFCGIPFIISSDGEIILAESITNLTANGFTIKSPVAGTLHCVTKIIS